MKMANFRISSSIIKISMGMSCRYLLEIGRRRRRREKKKKRSLIL